MQKIKIEWHFAAFVGERDREPVRLELKPRLGTWITENYPLLLKRLKDDPESNNSTAMEVFSVKLPSKAEPIWLFCALCVNRTLPPDAVAAIFPTQETALIMMKGFQQTQQERLSGPLPGVNRISQEEFRSLFQKPKFSTEYSRVIEERTQEVEWWADKQRRILGTLIHDVPDDDWSPIILARDEVGRFRCIDALAAIPDRAQASRTLQDKMREYLSSGLQIFPQYDARS
jgi:hypothetical protein